MTNSDIQIQVRPLVDNLMSELLDFFKINSSLPKTELLEKWNNFKESDAKRIVTEVTLICIEKENIDLNNIKETDFKKLYPIIKIYPQNIEEVINQNYAKFIHKLVNGT